MNRHNIGQGLVVIKERSCIEKSILEESLFHNFTLYFDGIVYL